MCRLSIPATFCKKTIQGRSYWRDIRLILRQRIDDLSDFLKYSWAGVRTERREPGKRGEPGVLMYSAPFLATMGISRTDPRWRIRLSQAEGGAPRRTEGSRRWGSREGPGYPFPAKILITRSHSSWQEGIAEKQAKRSSTNEEGA